MRAILIALAVFGAHLVHAQTPARGFVSLPDQDLSVKTVTMAPLSDNVDGIYARPLNDTLSELLRNDPQWNLALFPNFTVKTELLPDNPAEVQKILRAAHADALFTGRLLKGPGGLNLKLTLFVGSSGLPLAQEEVTETQAFDTAHVRELLTETFRRLRSRLPYRGTVVSRRGQEVTINLGSKEGLRPGDEVPVIQILQLRRHPKLNFMIGSEKVIVGKIRVTKTDDELSFGDLTYEREAGLVAIGFKVLPDEGVNYLPAGGPDAAAAMNQRADKNIAFGEKPVEWLPEPPPQYGRVQILGGFGQYSQTVSLTQEGAQNGSNSFTPNLALNGEGWLNRDWFVGFGIRQSAFSIGNPLPGSSPGKLNFSTGKYDVSAGYNFLLSQDFFGPKIQASLGLGKFSSHADASSPAVFLEHGFWRDAFGFLLHDSGGRNSALGCRRKVEVRAEPLGQRFEQFGQRQQHLVQRLRLHAWLPRSPQLPLYRRVGLRILRCRLRRQRRPHRSGDVDHAPAGHASGRP